MRKNLFDISSQMVGKKLTAGQKMDAVNTILGNPNIANQQGTSRVLFDSLPMDGRTVFEFFDSVNTRVFPFTNLNQNKLQVGETFAFNRIYFAGVDFDPATPDSFLADTLLSFGLDSMYGGDFDINYDTMKIQKSYPLTSMQPEFNHWSRHATNQWIQMDSYQVLPTDIQFTVVLRVPPYVANEFFIRCVVEGQGTLFSPKAQF